MAFDKILEPESLRAFAHKSILLVAAFCSLYLIAGEDGAPGGPLFSLLLVFAAALVGGKVVTAIGRGLPPLLGMLIAGFLLRNLPFVGERVGERIHAGTSAAIRLIALALILCRAGLGLDVDALQRLRWVVLRLAIMPCLTEALVVAVFAVLFLEFPVAWGAMLGFVVAAVSPAVVVPSLLSLQERGYGVATGIPSMVVAAAALDDVFSIAGFGVCLGLAVRDADGEGELWLDVVRAPLEILLGTGVGLLAGAMATTLLRAVPAESVANGSHHSHAMTLFAFAVLSAFGLKKGGFSGASALAVLVLAVVVARRWGKKTSSLVAGSMGQAWNNIAQPLLFGLVGAAVSLGDLDARLIGLGVGMLVCSLTFRCAVTFLAVGGKGLRKQERFFAALAWMPKATVQAAVGAVALDEATTDEDTAMGRDVLALAVLSILCTAPLGAVVISMAGPRLLILDQPPEAAEAAAKPGDEPGSATAEKGAAAEMVEEDLAAAKVAGVAASAAEREPLAPSAKVQPITTDQIGGEAAAPQGEQSLPADGACQTSPSVHTGGQQRQREEAEPRETTSAPAAALTGKDAEASAVPEASGGKVPTGTAGDQTKVSIDGPGATAPTIGTCCLSGTV